MSDRVPMISRARHFYGGRWLSTGEPFMAASEADAADLVAVNFAHRDQRVMIPPTTMHAVVTSPIIEPQPERSQQAGRRRGVYKTKARAA